MFKKILIANRGEIAVDIIKVCKKMGIKTVAIYSKEDKNSMHTSIADESYCIGPANSKESYLNINNIISLAIATKSDAIHPGYGFLSENYEFAQLCTENGITFIGPTYEIIKTMSNKMSAKRLVRSLGIPVIEALEIKNNDLDSLKMTAENIGYPIIIKSKNGGGGRGIRVVKNENDLEKSLFEVLQESEQYFNNKDLYIEKYLESASHIEVQIVADNHGNVVHLGTRDCSIQISNQKIIEEAMDNKIDSLTREKMCNLCKDVAKKIGYTNCGTFEFLVDKNNNFYFMEINCRLQVERCVTEAITGIDLIETQINISSNRTLPWEQKDIKFKGHAIECRINLEKNCNGLNSFKITDFFVPNLENVKFKTSLKLNSYVPPFYDSMIGKLIVHSKSRSDSINKMQNALENIVISGIDTNIETHKKILKNSRFIDCTHTTNFMNTFNNPVSFNRLNVYKKVEFLADKDSFKEFDRNLESKNIISFDNYEEKLIKAKKVSESKEAVIWGQANINSIPCILVIMDGNFMMGSMGVVVGEKITRAFEFATTKNLPVIALTISGGARMQEGIFSLMQMVKTSSAVFKHSEKNLLYIAVITDPTLGGVSASFATLADIIISEKNAKFGFSGRRIVEEVIRKPLPDNFQSSEFNLNHGMVDMVIDYEDIRETLGKILKLHSFKIKEK